jgi:hypothetical protein
MRSHDRNRFQSCGKRTVQKGGTPINIKSEGATRVCVREGGLAGYGRSVAPVGVFRRLKATDAHPQRPRDA